jgi:maltoporin
MDYYWLDMSGYGAGVKNIDLGIGKLWVAYLGAWMTTSPHRTRVAFISIGWISG